MKPNEQALAAMRAVAADLGLVGEANDRAAVAARAARAALENGDIARAREALSQMIAIGQSIQPRISLLGAEWQRVQMLDPVAWAEAMPRPPEDAPPPAPQLDVQLDTSGPIDMVAKILGLDPQVCATRMMKLGAAAASGPPRAIDAFELLETLEECRRTLAIHNRLCSDGKDCDVHRSIAARMRQLGGTP